MEQKVSEATRGNNILDLFATNDHELVSRVIVEQSRLSDHNIIIIKTTIRSSNDATIESDTQCVLDNLNFWNDNTDWSSIRLELGKVNWTRLYSNSGASHIYGSLLEILTDTCSKFTPSRGKKHRGSIPRDRRILMRNRNNARKKRDACVSLPNIDKLDKKIDDIEIKLIESHIAERNLKEKSAIDRIRDNPKFFFKYAREKSTVKSPIGPLSHNGEIYSNSKQICEILKNHFESVFSLPANEVCIENVLEIIGPRCVEDLNFTVEDVKKNIMEISPKAAAGPDGVPAIVLRNCVEELKTPIYMLWRASLSSGYLPEGLKQSKVIPIHKGGDKCCPENYRPISLTSHISKIFERIIVKNMVAYLNSMQLYDKNQHGFRSGRSCLSQLMEHQQKILSYLEEGCDVDVVYLDFAKAFDKVDYGVLIHKLKLIGIGGKLLQWIYCFLCGRKQRISVERVLSEPAPVLGGVPQGSSLGPFPFLIPIQGVPKGMDTFQSLIIKKLDNLQTFFSYH